MASQTSCNSSKLTPVQLYSMFARKHHNLINYTPYDVKALAASTKTEKVIGINEMTLKQLQNYKVLASSVVKVPVFPLNRGIDEFFGDHYQLVCAACIHDRNTTLLLKLATDTSVDHYKKGTLTYVQGHCKFDGSFEKELHDGMIGAHFLIDKLREDAYREITEEIKVEDYYANLRFMNELKERLYTARLENSLYPIYINGAGTTGRHLCMLFDIDMTQTCYEDIKGEIVSNEPDKHSVVIASYQDLAVLDRVDTICPWVQYSFGELPFYNDTFIPKTKGGAS